MTASDMGKVFEKVPFGEDRIELIYNPNEKIYRLICSKWYKDTAKDAGFTWNNFSKSWETKDVFSAIRLVAYANLPTRNKINEEWQKASQSFALSSATECEISIPSPKGMEYKPFQKAGIRYALSRTGTLIGDEMGLGKTIQALGVVNYLTNVLSNSVTKIQSVLIICPASLKINWRNEARAWLCGNLTYAIATGRFWPRHFDIIIINYDILYKWQKELTAKVWDLVIGDEIHFVKNPGARRSNAFYNIPSKIKIGLSGTPMEKSPTDLFPIANWLDPNSYPSASAFKARYVIDKDTAKNLEELQGKLRATIMIRRLKKDVLKELPPKVRQIIQLPIPPYAKALIEEENRMYNSREYLLNEAQGAIERARKANNPAQYKEAVAHFQKTAGSIFADLAKTRQEVAMVKAPLLLEHVKDSAHSEHKIILFCHHHQVMDYFLEKLGSVAVKFSGKESLQQRDQAVQAFQNNPNIHVFVGSTHAAGVGITLTESSHVIFAELDWMPSKLTQAEDRAHRIGQHDSVLVQHFVLEGSLDLRIAERLVTRQEMVDKALNEPSNLKTNTSIG